MRVAVCQLNSQDDKEKNVTEALELVDRASREQLDLIALPEYLDFQGPREQALAVAEGENGETLQRFQAKARELGVAILMGSVRVQGASEGKVLNRSILIDKSGDVVAHYDKTHLYDVDLPGRVTYKESDTIEPGRDIVVASLEGRKVGMSICYDVRFPELYRLLALEGAQVLFVPAAFALYTGRDHWEVLLRARAIENQCFVVAPGQIGPYPPSGACNGRSMIIDPWGNVMAQAPDRVGYVVAELEFDLLDKVRAEMPSLQNRRADVYALAKAMKDSDK
ncbi:carbon-nitrogen hydrolase family protein [Tranquillimonas alkanivorans]|nr:carbon-nitrogen hydrolase family protein [Tranquillimonas alkanivorans]